MSVDEQSRAWRFLLQGRVKSSHWRVRARGERHKKRGIGGGGTQKRQLLAEWWKNCARGERGVFASVLLDAGEGARGEGAPYVRPGAPGLVLGHAARHVAFFAAAALSKQKRPRAWCGFGLFLWFARPSSSAAVLGQTHKSFLLRDALAAAAAVSLGLWTAAAARWLMALAATAAA